MKEILVVSHSNFASGIIDACKMIVGEDLVKLDFVTLDDKTGISGFKERLNLKLDNINDQSLILADLKGGSPYLSVIEALDTKNMFGKINVISGVNLPLLLSVCFVQDFSDLSALNDAVSSSQEVIEIYSFEGKDIEEDDFIL